MGKLSEFLDSTVPNPMLHTTAYSVRLQYAKKFKIDLNENDINFFLNFEKF
jgi:hypothetical protein